MALIVVGLSDMKISRQPGDVLVTYALGSCLGVAAHDQRAEVGGLLHVMLPKYSSPAGKQCPRPLMYVDTAVPIFFRELLAAGATRPRLEVKIVGGSSRNQEHDVYEIGKRNILMIRKLFWKNNIGISKEDVGGTISRTLRLEIGTGRTWIHSDGKEWEL